jgi:hypothetical protein
MHESKVHLHYCKKKKNSVVSLTEDCHSLFLLSSKPTGGSIKLLPSEARENVNLKGSIAHQNEKQDLEILRR